jgi:hypothetical protein
VLAGFLTPAAQNSTQVGAPSSADRGASVVGIGPTFKPGRTEPLEKYDNPPAYIYRLESSPRMISQFGPFTSYQVNVDANGNNIVGDAANEPSIAVDPTNHNKMAIGWRQFDSFTSNFRKLSG